MAFGMFFCTLHDTTESIVCQEKRAAGSLFYVLNGIHTPQAYFILRSIHPSER